MFFKEVLQYISIYIIYVKLHYDYIKIIKYLQIFKDYIYLIVVGKSSVQLDKMFLFGFKELKINIDCFSAI